MRLVRFAVVLSSFAALVPLVSAADRIVVGVSRFPSVSDLSSSGQAAGFAADVIREAARRQGIEVSWHEVKGGGGAEQELEQRTIDVYPVAFDTPERRARFYLTQPWWYEDLSLFVVLGGPRSQDDLAGKRITLGSHLGEHTMRLAFPRSSMDVPEPAGFWSAAVPVCRGQAAAALMPDRWVVTTLADRPPECQGLRLELVTTPARIGVALMTTRQRAGLADRLRHGIDQLAEDGALSRIAEQHPGIPSSSAVVLAERMRRQGEQRVLWIVIVAAGLTMTVAGVLIFRMHRYQTALVASDKQLRESNSDLQAYAYTVSHDLQEPLRMVTAYTDLLERRLGESMDERAREMMATVREGALRMSTMLRDLLHFNSIGREDDPPANVDTETVVHRAIATLRLAIDESGGEIVIGQLPPVRGWEGRLEQVFQNLIGNALKYRRPGVRPRILIEAERTADAWRFSVSDNGIGIRTEYAEKIFRVFQRLHSRADYSGNGIGLAIAKRIIDRHGGRIWLDWSELDIGSRFSFTLPPADGSSAAANRLTSIVKPFQIKAT